MDTGGGGGEGEGLITIGSGLFCFSLGGEFNLSTGTALVGADDLREWWCEDGGGAGCIGGALVMVPVDCISTVADEDMGAGGFWLFNISDLFKATISYRNRSRGDKAAVVLRSKLGDPPS